MDGSSEHLNHQQHEFVEIKKVSESNSNNSDCNSNNSNNKDLQAAIESFEKTFQMKPQQVSRAPGRVNIIGEHIDYNGFGVLPMALEKSIFVACASTPTESGIIAIDLHSTSPGADACQHTCNFSKIPSDSNAAPPFETHHRDWSQYVLCALYGVLEALSTQKRKQLGGQKLNVMVHGTIPQGAGLSSSSALVVSSALVFLSLIGELSNFTKTQIASLCARSERWVGTEGGGMDQAISLFAEENTACYIQFNPTLSHIVIPLPKSTSWVVCHSLEESHKRGTAATHFNKRVVECKIGCRMVAQLLHWQEHHQSGYPESLWELVGKTGLPLGQIEAMVSESLKNVYTKQEVLMAILGDNSQPDKVQLELLASKLGITRKAGKEALAASEVFHVRDRLLHVFSETQRVQEFVCHCSEDHTDESILVYDLGKLMYSSHKSCASSYECSSPKVDKLQEICAIGPGAVGVRMTGAGWGGSVICLVQSKDVEAFCTHVQNRYYDRLTEASKQQQHESEYMFVTRSAQGSNVFLL